MDHLVETIKAYFERDWGQVLLTLLAILIALTFVGAPRATSEMIGLAIEAYAGSGGTGELNWLFLFTGAPAGLFARNWKNALILIALGSLAATVADLGSPSGPEEVGQTVVSLTSTTALVASLLRLMVLNIYAGQFETDPQQSLLDIGKIRGVQLATVAIALVGIIQIGSREVADDSYYYDSASSVEAVADEAAAESGMLVADPPQYEYRDFESPILDRIEASEGSAAGEEGLAENEAELDFSGLLPDPVGVEDILNPGRADRAADDAAEQERQNSEEFSPSFDCSVHLGRVETMICSDKELADSDVRLSSVFKAKLADTPREDRPGMLSKQREVLAERNACPTQECVSNWYSRELSNY